MVSPPYHQQTTTTMLIKTLLNQISKFKHFVFQNGRFEQTDTGQIIIVEIQPRANSKATCSRCEKPSSTYDHIGVRRFQYVPLWGFPVYFEYNMRRVDCESCGVKVEGVPWASGKCTVTNAFRIVLARWAKKLSWQEVADSFNVSWDKVYSSIEYVVSYGLENRDLSEIGAIGVDEIKYSKGHKYLTLVYQIDEGRKRLLYVVKDRTKESFRSFFTTMGKDVTGGIQYVCSDMWKNYLTVIKEEIPDALNILDRFHIVKHLNEAVNDVRKQEARELIAKGYENVLSKMKYCFLKREENLTPSQSQKLNETLEYGLKTVRAYLLKCSFEAFWQYESPHWAQWYLKKWCTRAMRSRLDPMKKFVRTLRNHEDLLMNWFKAKKQFNSGIVEGLNRKVNLVTRRSYGFKKYETLQIALYHNLGDLPEPEPTHRFF